MRDDAPVREVRRLLESRLGTDCVPEIPRGYVRFGDVLVLDPPPSHLPLAPEVARAYAEVLRMRSVLALESGIEGELREPRARLLWGDPNTETTHVENGVRYAFDPARVMWSPGNMAERRRVASWDCSGETVVDLFAGIGYFSLPLALHAKAERVVAVEKNPVAFSYLQRNVKLNGVADHVECRLGDNRVVAPPGVAHRILMGYLHDTPSFLPLALRVLRPEGGFLHIHAKLPEEDFPDAAMETLAPRFAYAGRAATLVDWHEVKSYAPRILHGVLDVEVGPSGS